ncbi:CDGSH iron-sulfur domain-containing protein [Tomitella biformata]|nr:CDGSH iron-sulfur domain-containing protein [Tomitella biformata]
MNSVSNPQSDNDDVTITVCPDGPLLVRGPVTLIDADGNPIKKERPTIALCRCRGTSIAPFCDGTHKKRRRRQSST